ncbi:MAG: phosphate ABC transporter substrate-binding protein PstS family protein [Methanotrichaceae archaeon]
MLLVAFILGSISISAVAKTTVSVSGSTTVLPLAEACAEAFNSQSSDYQVLVTGGGTGAGITAAAEGRSDIAMASREVTADEMKKYSNKFEQNEIGYDGVCIAVSKQIYDAGVTNLTKDQVKEIYAGNITNWNQVGGPDKPIYAIAREQGSGTRDTFNELIMGSTKAETKESTVAQGSAEVKTAIVGSDKAIGYVGFSYIQDDTIKAIALNGVLPTVQSIKNGSYLLSRHLYLYTFGDPTPGAKAFIDFTKSAAGQNIAQENGFIPLTSTANVQPVESNVSQSSAQASGGQAPAQKTPGFEGIFALGSLLGVFYLILGGGPKNRLMTGLSF